MRRVHFDVTDSTNTQARRLAGDFPGERILVTADEQRAGRGRLGRMWHSPRGGAWLSLAWPMHNAPGTYATASLVAAVATLRAIREAAPRCADRLHVKWPNDLLLDGRKVAGILCEQFLGGVGEGVLVVGVGVNVDVDLAELGSELRHPATTLRSVADQTVTVETVIDALARHLTDALVDFEAEGLSEPVLVELRTHLAYAGSVQSFELAGRVATGMVAGVDASGRLVLACEEGDVVFDSGEFLAGGASSRQL
jgi:BirA family biotin operon repressor/biotin-[acetyl-CoA-carboxylase] ligase